MTLFAMAHPWITFILVALGLFVVAHIADRFGNGGCSCNDRNEK